MKGSSQTIRVCDLYHGGVLSIIAHNQLSGLLVIETRAPGEYILNDATTLYLKHSSSPHSRTRDYGLSWSFTFSGDHVVRVQELIEEKDLNLVLVCGDKDINRIGNMQTCMIRKQEITDFLDLSTSASQQIKVDYSPGTGQRLRVRGSIVGSESRIPRSRLQAWQVPGL
jgi:hypothetical protein